MELGPASRRQQMDRRNLRPRPRLRRGALVYQFSPHDLFDWDGVNEQILLDMEWNGQPRKVLVRPERNGYVYVLDRTTGEVLSANGYLYVIDRQS